MFYFAFPTKYKSLLEYFLGRNQFSGFHLPNLTKPGFPFTKPLIYKFRCRRSGDTDKKHLAI